MVRRERDAAKTKQQWIQRRAERHSKKLLEDTAQDTVVQVQPNGILMCKTEHMDKRYWTGQTSHSRRGIGDRMARDRSALLADPIMTNPSALEPSWKTKVRGDSKKAELVCEEEERRARAAERLRCFRMGIK